MCGSLWICQAVTGYSIDFDSEPPMQCTGPTYYRTKEEEEALHREIAELIAKKAVEEVDFCQAKFVSPMFIVPKKRGKWRLVLNLQSLNQYVSRVHFKLEDIRSLKDILRQGDFMANWTSKKPISGFQWLIKAGVSCSSIGRTSFSNPPAFPSDSAVPFCMKAGDWPRSPRKILITSLWKSQAWFPLILRMLVEIPLLVQSHKKILTDPLGNSHPMVLQSHLQLVAWTVSGVRSQD